MKPPTRWGSVDEPGALKSQIGGSAPTPTSGLSLIHTVIHTVIRAARSSSHSPGMGKKKGKAPAVSDDDALLDAAIAEKDAAVRKMQAEAKEKDSSELALSAQLAAAQLGMQEQLHPRLTVKEIV